MELTNEEIDALWKERGWDGVSCRLCFVRRWKLANEPNTWNIQFRFCPHCAANW